MFSLKLLPQDLNLELTLKCGQAFRWRRISQGVFRSALRGRVWTLTQTQASIDVDVHFPKTWKGVDDSEAVIHDYLNLKVDLTKLYARWCSADPHFLKTAGAFPGIRMLRQDPFENLMCFICSTNNNIGRITKMVDAFCTMYGERIMEIDGQIFHDFPKLENLQHATLEAELRDIGFGYRAKFIASTSRMLAELPADYLINLRKETYEDSHTALLKFMGVGHKVADCVALMSLDQSAIVPVDTHVLQIAYRDYKLKTKDIDKIKEYFIELWGSHAGWAHSILFTADLKDFKTPAVKQESIKAELDALESAQTQACHSSMHSLTAATVQIKLESPTKRRKLVKI